MRRYMKNNRFHLILLFTAIVFWLVLFVPETYAAEALATKALTLGLNLFSWFADAAILLVGNLLYGAVMLLTVLSQYNSFIKEPFVNTGWVIVRDLVNMFFILALLAIAFATVLKIESYSYQKLLSRLIIIAILVNFSKLAVGFVIDFFQVIMITFVNAYKSITGPGFAEALRVATTVQMNNNIDPNTLASLGAPTGQLAAKIFGLLFLIISCVVVVIYLILMAYRFIALWILTILSPLAFFSWIFKEGKSKVGDIFNKWFSELLNWSMIGPMLAFFLWLSLTVALGLPAAVDTVANQAGVSADQRSSLGLSPNNKAGDFDNSLRFLMAILMLIGGLKYTQDIGGYAGKMASKAEGQARALGRKAGSAISYATGAGAIASGVSAGVRERLLRSGGPLASLTKEGREERTARLAATVSSRVGGTPGTRLAVSEEQAKKQAARLEKTGEIEKPEDMQKLLASSGDLRTQMAMATKLAEKGQLRDVDIDHIRNKIGKQLTKGERDQYFEKLEKSFTDSTGRKLSISDINYDPETGAMLSSGYAEVQKHMANANRDTVNKATGKESFANAKDNTAETVAAEVDGVSNNLKNVGGMDDKARERLANHMDFMYADSATQEKMFLDGKIAGFKKRKKGDVVDGKALTADEDDASFLARIKSDRDKYTKTSLEVRQQLESKGVDSRSLRLALGAKYSANGERVGSGDNGGAYIDQMKANHNKVQKDVANETYSKVETQGEEFLSRSRIALRGKDSKEISALRSIARQIDLQMRNADRRGNMIDRDKGIAAVQELEKIEQEMKDEAKQKGGVLEGADLAKYQSRTQAILSSLKSGEYAKHEPEKPVKKKIREFGSALYSAAKDQQLKEQKEKDEQDLQAGISNLAGAVKFVASKSPDERAQVHPDVQKIEEKMHRSNTELGKLITQQLGMKSNSVDFNKIQNEIEQLRAEIVKLTAERGAMVKTKAIEYSNPKITQEIENTRQKIQQMNNELDKLRNKFGADTEKDRVKITTEISRLSDELKKLEESFERAKKTQ